MEYDIFFNGGSDQFPQQAHEAVENEVKRFFDVQSLSYAQRFRLNSLASRLSEYNDLWKRNVRAIEQGRKVHGVVRVSEPARRVEVTIGDAGDRESLGRLYMEYCNARERTGNITAVDPLRFEELVTSKLRETQLERSCAEVVFVVMVESGKALLRTRPKR